MKRFASRVPIALAALAIACSGCDLMTATVTPQPSRLSRTPEPLPTLAPEATDEGPTPRPASSGPDLVDASNALADLDSYRVAVSSIGIVPATSADGEVRMSSTIVNGQEPAVRFSISGLDGLPGGRLEAIEIGDQAWTRDDAGRWTRSPDGAADFDPAFTALSPMDLVTQFDGLAPALVASGSGKKNGIATKHYRIESSSAAAAAAGLTSGSAELWIASRGDYLVSFSLVGAWDVDGDGTATPVTLRIDVSHVNDGANTVRPPG